MTTDKREVFAKYKARMNHPECAAIMQHALHHLLQAGGILSPTLDAQAALNQLVKSAKANGKTPLETTGALLCAILDGITVGNWPDDLGV